LQQICPASTARAGLPCCNALRHPAGSAVLLHAWSALCQLVLAAMLAGLTASQLLSSRISAGQAAALPAAQLAAAGCCCHCCHC
jgi:hypothetical protein